MSPQRSSTAPRVGDRPIAWTALHRFGNLGWMEEPIGGEPRVYDLAGMRAALTPGR